MRNLLGFDLKRSNWGIVSLSSVYGIGRARALYLFNLYGLSRELGINELNMYTFDSLRVILNSYSYKLHDYLKTILIRKLEFFLEIFCYKGWRFRHGLSMRGQRTSSNSKTVRKFCSY